MRINRFVAQASGRSRRQVDQLILQGRVRVNGAVATTGQDVQPADQVTLDNQTLVSAPLTTIMLNKPPGYVTSRTGQGSRTIYELLPIELHHLKPVGRLDKDSSGLLLLTNDGALAHQLTHPSFQKLKVYRVQLRTALTPADREQLQHGVLLDDGPSHLRLSGQGTAWTVRLHEGRNRQIRRSFAVLGYKVVTLHRISFGPYQLKRLRVGKYQQL